ncbi:MAG: [ribosomal protein S18]-alanine N-acetyltransferase, partial [Chloroflexota bacterium]|nr:[ribosomal protein S18]-alanine N-acetyltransferase [Chloroflexota bacterium]
LERICFKDPWTRRMYQTDLTENELATYRALRLPLGDAVWQSANSKLHGAGRGSAVAGAPAVTGPILAYGGFWLMVDEAHIATIATRPEWRGCGLGLLLMLELLDRAIAQGARTSTLEVRGGNLPAQQLYEKLGYAVVGRRRRYYRDGEDGLLMTTPDLTAPAMQARLAVARLDAMMKLERCLLRQS